MPTSKTQVNDITLALGPTPNSKGHTGLRDSRSVLVLARALDVA